MRRKVWAWPVGIIGNLLLLTVFLGSIFDTGHAATCWARPPPDHVHRRVLLRLPPVAAIARNGTAISPRWATARERWTLLVLVIGTIALTPLFRILGSYEPVWADA